MPTRRHPYRHHEIIFDIDIMRPAIVTAPRPHTVAGQRAIELQPNLFIRTLQPIDECLPAVRCPCEIPRIQARRQQA